MVGIKHLIFAVLIGGIAFSLFSCDQAEDDPDNFELSGTVLQSPLIPVGVPEVMVEVSVLASTANGDQGTFTDVLYTDENGVYRFNQYLTFPTQDDDGNLTYEPFYQAFVSLTYTFTDTKGQTFSYNVQNIFVSVSEERNLQPVYLTQFQ
ncbi:MAG: hypothetical protein D6675_11370 [Gemmatimonadetes bacterium]|nr:MAG: hypothetical protein D6675_11370 [Gemmatimonadota bacterium]